MKNWNKKKVFRYIFKISIGFLFGYFGLLALANPELEGAKWLSSEMSSLITVFVPVKVFMLFFGAVQAVLAGLLILDKFSSFALATAAVLTFGIIVNLGWNEIALRDLVILAGVLHLYFSEQQEEEKIFQLRIRNKF